MVNAAFERRMPDLESCEILQAVRLLVAGKTKSGACDELLRASGQTNDNRGNAFHAAQTAQKRIDICKSIGLCPVCGGRHLAEAKAVHAPIVVAQRVILAAYSADILRPIDDPAHYMGRDQFHLEMIRIWPPGSIKPTLIWIADRFDEFQSHLAKLQFLGQCGYCGEKVRPAPPRLTWSM